MTRFQWELREISRVPWLVPSPLGTPIRSCGQALLLHPPPAAQQTPAPAQGQGETTADPLGAVTAVILPWCWPGIHPWECWWESSSALCSPRGPSLAPCPGVGLALTGCRKCHPHHKQFLTATPGKPLAQAVTSLQPAESARADHIKD